MNIVRVISVELLIITFMLANSSPSLASAKVSKENKERDCENEALLAPPAGYVFIEGSEYAALNSMPLDLLSEARTAFNNQNFSQSAKDIHLAAEFIKIQAEGNPKNENLIQTAKNLEDLSQRISNDKVESLATLDLELAKSARVQAEHHYIHATEAWALHMSQNVGADLKAAAKAVEQSAQWSGQKIENGGSDVIEGTKALSDKLVKGGKWSADEVGKGLTSLGNEITRLGKNMEPNPKDFK